MDSHELPAALLRLSEDELGPDDHNSDEDGSNG
jgi:hypothetical protein